MGTDRTARHQLRVEDVGWAETFEARPPGPPLRDLFGEGEAKRTAMRHHVAHRLEGYAKLGLSPVFRRLPMRWVSDLTGPVLAPGVARRYRPTGRWARMDRLIARMRPDMGDREARERFQERWYVNIGRAMGEFLIADRLVAAGCAQVHGMEHQRAAVASERPVIVVTVHTAAWEVTGMVSLCEHFANRGVSSWQPQANRFENRLVARARQRCGYKVLAPRPRLAARLRQVLNTPGQMLFLLVDEQSENQNKFPLFGRPAPSRCNLSFALRLAAGTGALILPLTTWRTADALRYAMAYHPPLDVSALPAADRLAAGAEALNAVFEPHVVRHLDEWYMLHSIKL